MSKKSFGAWYFILIVLCALYSGNYAIAEEPYVYDSAGKRDPFVPLIGVDSSVIESLEDIMSIDDVKFQGIAKDAAGNNIAIINGEIVRAGDVAGRVSITEIRTKQVILKISSDEYTLDIDEIEKGAK